jgi:PAS domain S-box-containing protein
VLEAATGWQVRHSAALGSAQGRAEYVADLSTGLESYESLLLELDNLRATVDDQLRSAVADLQAIEEAETRIRSVLAILALVALALVFFLSRRLSTAVAQATARGMYAVEARREIDAVLEATAEAVLGLDLDRMVIRLNAAGSRLLGFTEEDALGRPFQDVLHAGLAAPEERSNRPEAEGIRRAMEAGEAVRSVDGQVHPRGGGEVEIRWSLRPLVDGRAVRGAVVTVTDMREVRRAEKALRRAVEAREETLAVVGHDLRSPLASISAGAELLLEVPLSEEKERRQLLLIRSAADRMNRLIQDLMDVARMDSGGFQVLARRGELASALDMALSHAESHAAKAEVTLTRAWPPSLPPVWIDEHRIVQVVDNLVSNALRCTSPGGTVEVGAAVDDAGVEVWVRDTGAGIAAEDIEHLWDPFWRPEGSDAEGAGLGLAIVRGIVEAHGGTVSVDSRPGQGSRFAFTLRGVGRDAPSALLPPSALGSS